MKQVPKKPTGEVRPVGTDPVAGASPSADDVRRLAARRKTAARRYRPARTRMLLVVEAPPADPTRYLYFDELESSEPLFLALCHVLFEEDAPEEKASYLKALRRRGLFVTELDDGTSGAPIAKLVPWLPLRVEAFAPEHVVLIGAALYREAFELLSKGGVPVVANPVPTPTNANRAEFAREMRTALVRAGMESAIKPLGSR